METIGLELDETGPLNCSSFRAFQANIDQEVQGRLNLSYDILTMTASVLSIIGCSLIFYFYFTAQELRSPTRRLLVFLSISDLLIACGNISGAIWMTFSISNNKTDIVLNPTDGICIAQAAVTSTASVASFFWTMFIALNGYLFIILENNSLISRFWFIPHIFSWGVPLMLLVIVSAEHRYGFDPCTLTEWWCWIRRYPATLPMLEQQDVILWQLISGKFWEIMAYLFVAIVYSSIRYQLKRHVKRMERHRAEANRPPVSDGNSPVALAFADANRKLIFVPAVFIVARIWGTLRFLLDLVDDDTSKTIASYIAPLQGVGDSAQGFLNCIVFIWLTPVLRDKFTSKLTKFCCRCTRLKTADSIPFTPEGSSLSTNAVQPARGMTYGTMTSKPHTSESSSS